MTTTAMTDWRIDQGHVLDVLRGMDAESVQCVVTSPPYWGLRAYKTEPQVWGGDENCAHAWDAKESIRTQPALSANSSFRDYDRKTADAPRGNGVIHHAFCTRCGAWLGELGSEPTIELYVEHIVMVFREVARVLRPDGTCWVNIGDSYAGSGKGTPGPRALINHNDRQGFVTDGAHPKPLDAGLKQKDLCLIPFRLALALQADGWYVRSDIAWCKRAPMPESVTDRPTSAWEHVFLLTRSARYYYDQEAVREEATEEGRLVKAYGEGAKNLTGADEVNDRRTAAGFGNHDTLVSGRNQRNYWLLSPEPFPDAHFATFPTEIPRRCILAGSREGDIVLDPFAGSGTTLMVALRHNRRAIGIELNPEYAALAERRILADAPLWNGQFAW